jgi:hypothetical protein
MSRLQEKWDAYAAQVIPQTASRVQVQETRRAFYAGAMAYLTLLLSHLTPDAEPTQEDVSLLERLNAELDAFAADVTGGRA